MARSGKNKEKTFEFQLNMVGNEAKVNKIILFSCQQKACQEKEESLQLLPNLQCHTFF